MNKLFKNFKLNNFVTNFIICIIYPIIKTIISDNKLIVLSDSLFIMSLIYIVFGVINSLILHGDFDITNYIIRRTSKANSNLTFDKFSKDIKDERKGSFNYPLFIGIFVLIISYIIAIFV